MTSTKATTTKTANRIRELAHELGIIVQLPPPEMTRAAARTFVRRQLLPGQLYKLTQASGKTDKTVLRALGCAPSRSGRKAATEKGVARKTIETERAVKWLIRCSKLREISSEAAHALECAALGLDRGDAHGNKNPYTGEEFK